MPADPKRRLETLAQYGILDTSTEAVFDQIVDEAAAACAAPIALISFVDEHRQWFKAERGMGMRQTGLERSICAKAIEHDGVFVVPDAEVDPRVNSNPLVFGHPGIRFYAGAPLIAPGGVAIGMVCVLDTHQRAGGLTDHQIRVLRDLARRVMGQLQIRADKREVDSQPTSASRRVDPSC